jgi:arylsulfatase A
MPPPLHPKPFLWLALSIGWMPLILTAYGAERPNIVLVVADDLGYSDLACFGSTIAQTPAFDRFAAEGMKLTACYAGHANCSPSRAALMTGRTPMRAGIRSAIPLGSPMHLRRQEVTVAKLLQQAGYATAHIGKWHLNGLFNDERQPQPDAHGFDHYYSTQNNALPNHRQPSNFVRNGRAVGPTTGFAGAVVTDEAIRWLQADRPADKPFFLYVCFHEPHEPIATDPAYARIYPSADPSYSAYYGNISQLDAAFGRLMQALDAMQLRDNTWVMFTSDNGPAITSQHPHGSAAPLRGKKGMLWEGGIRVPGIIRWPSAIAARQVSDTPVSGVDFLPTACELAGIRLPSGLELDGTSLVPLFRGQPLARAKPLYWHFHRAAEEPKVAMRLGDWKILAGFTPGFVSRSSNIDRESEREVKQAQLGRCYLFNLRQDIGETTDLAASQPQRLAEMKATLQEMFAEVQTETPLWPFYINDNAEGKLIVWPDYVRKRSSQAAPRVRPE